MRSSRSALALALVLAACGNDRDARCASSPLTYATFGEPFMISWCRGCHSVDVLPGMRQDAPLGVDFDTLAQVRSWRHEIAAVAGRGMTMPPVGGPSAEERALLTEWLDCGAP